MTARGTFRIALGLMASVSIASGPSLAQTAPTKPFNWKLTEGSWSESTRHQYACRADNVQFRIVVAPDKKRVTFKYDRLISPDGGKETRELGAEVLRADDHSLVLKYDKENPLMSTGEWELRFLGPGVYRMGFSGWDKGTYNNVVGVKCGP